MRIIVLLVVASLSVAKPGQIPSLDPAATMARLESASVEERRAAMRAFVESLGTEQVKELKSEILPPIAKGAADEDTEVRRWAFGALNLLAHMRAWTGGSRSKVVYGARMLTSLEDEPRLRPLILERVEDANVDIREYAIAALSLGYPPSSDTEKLLLERLAAEKQRRVRRAIAAGLGAGKYRSKAAEDALVGLLDDPSEEIRIGVAEFLGEAKNARALLIIVQGLKSKSAYVRRGSAMAIEKYGPDAARVLDDLELASSEEKDPGVKHQLKAAIKSLRGDKQK